MNEVFISYKSEDFETAEKVRQTLELNGISCWMAPMSIRGGASYASEIPPAIKGCKAFVLILTQNAQTSKWIPRELDQAINDNRTILPFEIENCSVLRDDFAFYLHNVQRYFAYEDYRKMLIKLVLDIKNLLGMETSSPVKLYSDKPEPAPGEPAPVKPAEPEIHPVETVAKPKAEETAKQKKKIPKALKIVLPIVLGIILTVLAIIGVSSLANEKIAGEKIPKSSSYAEFKDKTFTDSDFEKISKLGIYRLSFTNCDLSGCDFSKLDTSKLSVLTVDSCGIDNEDINKLDLSEVYRLVLRGNNLTTLEGISFADDLSVLDISGNKVGSLKPLANISSLDSVYADGCGLTSLEGLEYSIELKHISACDNAIADLNGLTNATLLEEVKLSNNKISDVSVLAKSSATLKILLLNNNALDMFQADALSELTNITVLSIDNNDLFDIKFVSDMQNLEVFSAKYNHILSIEGFGKKTKCRYLDLSHNMISHVEDFSGFATDSKVKLILSDNIITSISLPSGEFSLLAVNGNKIENLSVLENAAVDTIIFDYSDKVDYSKFGANETLYSINILGCPLDKQVAVSDACGRYSTHFIESTEADEIISNALAYELK